MRRALVVILATLAVADSSQVSMRGIGKSKLELYKPNANGDFACLDASKKIPFERVNDDFCDCPDGSDEPGTSACPNGKFLCINKWFRPKNIPSSRVNDGVCDCCDGSDEWKNEGLCQNSCKELGAADRAKSQAQNQLAKEGMAKKADLIAEAKKIKEEQEAELAKSKEELEQLKTKLVDLKDHRDQAETLEKEARAKLESKNTASEIGEQKLQNCESKVSELQYVISTLQSTIEIIRDIVVRPDTTVTNKEIIDVLKFVQGFDIETGFQRPEPSAAPEDDESLVKTGEDDDDFDVSDIDAADQPDLALLTRDLENARSAVSTTEARVSTLETTTEDMRKRWETNFGPDNVFATLYHKCIEYKNEEYTYELCFFKEATQKSNSGSWTSLGRWTNWPENTESYNKMVYTGGVRCWNGPDRSATILLECGLETAITAVSEPARCEYEYRVVTPAVCMPVATKQDDGEN